MYIESRKENTKYYLEAKLLFTRTIPTLQELYIRHEVRTTPEALFVVSATTGFPFFVLPEAVGTLKSVDLDFNDESLAPGFACPRSGPISISV